MLPIFPAEQTEKSFSNPAELFYFLSKEGIGTNWGKFNFSESLPLSNIGAVREFDCCYMRGRSRVFHPMQGISLTMQTIEITSAEQAEKLLLYPSDKLYIAIVLQGSFELSYEDKAKQVNAGSYLLYRQTKNANCWIDIDPEKPLTLVYLAFTPECCETLSADIKTPLPKIIRAFEMQHIWGKEKPVVGEDAALLLFAKSLSDAPDYKKLWPNFLRSKLSELFCILSTFDSHVKDTLGSSSQISSLDRISKVFNLFLEDHVQIPSSNEVSKILGIDKQILTKDFEDVYGLNFPDFCNVIKFQLVYKRLFQTKISVTALAYWAGYSHIGNFSRAFHKQFGTSPRQARLSAKNLGSLFEKD